VDRDRFDARVGELIEPNRVQRNARLREITTFRLGGPADWLVEVRRVEELTGVMAAARDAGVPLTVIGGGSNVIVSEAGVRGAVVRLRLTGIEVPAPGRVRAEAGVTINGLVRWTVSRGLAGLEAWAGTPGTVGGAIHGNAHFGGVNIGDLVVEVLLVTPPGELVGISRAAMEFAYDTSRLRRTHEILLWADFAVAAADPADLRRTARQSLAYRKQTQPLAFPSAGCIFQNPDPARDTLPAGMPASAGALIDAAGLKGRRVGGARISPTHANFIVNEGQATAEDVRTLVDAARAAVRQKFGIVLRDEVVFLGRFD
jgi:UDP-N-acetylmuramate dehydrogenase